VPIVVDANLIAAAANREPAGSRVIDQIASWYEAGEELHAPALLYYEVVSAIRKAVWQGRLEPGLARQAIAIAEAVPLTVHPPSRLTRVLEIAEALGRRRTGDAVYIALAEELGGRVVTLDGSLARAGADAGLPVEALA
jgi:predicted nucleic acid-binding protein